MSGGSYLDCELYKDFISSIKSNCTIACSSLKPIIGLWHKLFIKEMFPMSQREQSCVTLKAVSAEQRQITH
ncbi:hypothetical protein XELAEV_18038228mg [Xenopus laevis]|uniref:Uncharacterized protein n=1 Tax=Xenopus laevis TaxID=8355 RepID=A0A974C6Q7_XENLA|nr:hypothetical protein XELAEV_18038228mg [Xenopus laevis]